ncbi:MAG: glutathione peroxidase [Cyclobacteriaceae bacterium]
MFLLILILQLNVGMTDIYNIEVETLTGETTTLAKYKGKKIIIVNTASECGYTPQYEDFQALHELHGDKVAILGFPSNQFGGQEPGSNDQIASFCKKNYGVSFDMFSKIDVKGDKKHPLYQWLTDEDLNGWNSQEPSWNFCKFLIDQNGKLIKFYRSGENPMDTEILNWVIATD